MQILLRFELATTFRINKDQNTLTSDCELKNEPHRLMRRRRSKSIHREKSFLSTRDEMKLEEEEETYLPHHELKVIKKFLESISILLDFDFNSHSPNYKGFASFFDDILFILYPFLLIHNRFFCFISQNFLFLELVFFCFKDMVRSYLFHFTNCTNHFGFQFLLL
jgi:hypothetical protein